MLCKKGKCGVCANCIKSRNILKGLFGQEANPPSVEKHSGRVEVTCEGCGSKSSKTLLALCRYRSWDDFRCSRCN